MNEINRQNELLKFLNQKYSYFDNLKEFENNLKNIDILEQIEWIENGTYGTGACIALKNAFDSLSNRCNKNARIGSIVLHAFYGKNFKYWNKLSTDIHKSINDAISTWIEQEHTFAI